MANSIGWGQGAINNLIGWGQGAINNLISWGKSHLTSYSGETNIAGAINYVNQYIDTFKSFVVADGGVFEAENCLYNTLNGELSNGFVLTDSFSKKVIADLGTMEANSCLINILNT